jgi:hypothetical protein
MAVVVINKTESLQGSYTALGLGPIPPGTPVDAAVKTLEAALFKLLAASWPSTYPTYPSVQDSGVMGPWNSNAPGTAPPCVTQQMTLDFQSWGLPVDENAITLMAEEITQQISNNGGQAGTFYGQTRVGASETMYWAVGFATGAIVDGPPEELGIIYTFVATLGLT